MRNYTIFRPDPELKRNLLSFGFDVGKGWLNLITELSDKIQDIVDKDETLSDVEVTQVKEKFGGLRYYINYGTEEIFDLINEYETKSYTICENCGNPGSLERINGWYQTICTKCSENYKNALVERYGKLE